MSKAAWVGLPIGLFVTAAVALALARRPLSRLSLNVWSSLLLFGCGASRARPKGAGRGASDPRGTR